MVNAQSGQRKTLWLTVMLAFGLVWSLPALSQVITAKLDRQSITEGETVTLTLETSDPQQSLDTDVSILDKDFHVIDQRSETRMSIVNGRQSAVVRNMITLEPRRTGEIRLPALSFKGGASTPVLNIKVAAAPQLAPGELPPVFIEMELDPMEGPYYVHAQLSLKVRIFYQQNLTEAAINPPTPEQASVRLLDEVPYQADRNGTKYRVLERRYAIFPERSGEMSIPPMQLTGRLIERPADRLWQPSVRGRRVRIESDPLSLTINPRPTTFAGEKWLPARSITLAQKITDGDTVKVGEPVTRTIILDAKGLEENMLEQPVWPAITKARIYPDQPTGISRDDGQWVLGHREYRYAVVPEEAGELVLPELLLYWWDTVSDSQQVARLPEHRVTVLPSGLPALSEASQALALERAVTQAGDSGGANGLWKALTGFFALLWLLTLVYYQRRRKAVASGAVAAPGDLDEKALRADFRKACDGSEARTAHEQLGRWVRHYGPSSACGTVMGLAQTCGDTGLAEAIIALDRVAYGGGDPTSWSGTELWKAFSDWRRRCGSAPGDPRGDAFDLYAPAR